MLTVASVFSLRAWRWIGQSEESKGQAFQCWHVDETWGFKVTDVWMPHEDVYSSLASSSSLIMFTEIPMLRGLGHAGSESWVIAPDHHPQPPGMNSPFPICDLAFG